ncbi:hypothetical protein SSS_10529, partial [Sarcoptes scabiei]
INSHFCYIDHRTDRVEAKRIKMLRQLLLLCLVAIVIDQALIVSAKSKNLKHPHHPHCPPHSHWAPCGLSCPKTCAHPYGPFRCPLVCKPGCKCDKDYVRRNSDGTGPCVRRRHCKDLTTENALNILIGLLVVFHARKHVHILMVH